MHPSHSFVQYLHENAVSIQTKQDLNPLVEQISQAKIVMLGESTHGTHEFYEWRRIISEWLIVKHGFQLIAVEGDWPPCWEVNRAIHGCAIEKEYDIAIRDVLGHFNRWPTWMWANTEVERLLEWMRTHNSQVTPDHPVGFYGLDVYSLFESIDEVLKQLDKINPFLARRARVRYACFDPFYRDERKYVKSLIQIPEGCEKEVVQNLTDLLKIRLNHFEHLKGSKEWNNIQDRLFNARQNAKIIADAERYYRSMVLGDEDSWNIRDQHMLNTLETLLDYYGPSSKAIVWAHNTHIGDYRATDMIREGQVNLGGLAREKWGKDHVALVGFGTYQGKVIASHAWDGPIEIMDVPPAQAGSFEDAFHIISETRTENVLMLSMKVDSRHSIDSMIYSETHGQRAIGVVYHPHLERVRNYVPTQIFQRYDAFLFVDKTTPVEPLIQSLEERDIPETWPRGV